MKLIHNTGTQCVIDLMRPHLDRGNRLDCVTPSSSLHAFVDVRDPFTIYTLMLHYLFRDSGDEMDEASIVKSATGIHNTVVWKKLKFQRVGVVGAIDNQPRRHSGAARHPGHAQS